MDFGGGILLLGVSTFSFPVFVLRGAKESSTHKILVGNQRERTTSCVAGHGFLFFLICLWQSCMFVQTLSGSKTFLYIFFDFLPIFNREFSSLFWSLTGNFLFLLFLKHICSLTVNGSSFLGDPSIPSSEGKDGNSYPRSRFMANELRFWLKRLVERPNMMYVGALVWPVVQG